MDINHTHLVDSLHAPLTIVCLLMIQKYNLYLSLDAPTVTLHGVPQDDIEEGLDNISLKCIADSNPPSNVMWRVAGDQNVFSFHDTVQFTPANRKNSASYTCEARNAVGVSDPIEVNIDVKCE